MMTSTTNLPVASRVHLLTLTDPEDRWAYDSGERDGLCWAPDDREWEGFICFARLGDKYGYAYEPQDGEANAQIDGEPVWIEGLRENAGRAYGEYIRIPGEHEA
jgi:hypothetical protein